METVKSPASSRSYEEVREVCVLTRLRNIQSLLSPKPSLASNIRILLRDLPVKGKGLILAWIAGRREDEIAFRDASGIYWFHMSDDESLLEEPLETLVSGYVHYRDGVVWFDDYSVLYRPSEERNLNYVTMDLPGIPALIDHYPWMLRNPRLASMIRLYSIVSSLLREALVRRGFIELPSPMIGYVSDPGLRGAGRLKTRVYIMLKF
jgi:asparaginyl-tRNA synthetase